MNGYYELLVNVFNWVVMTSLVGICSGLMMLRRYYMEVILLS